MPSASRKLKQSVNPQVGRGEGETEAGDNGDKEGDNIGMSSPEIIEGSDPFFSITRRR